MNSYRWNAKDYARHSSVQQAWARELIAKLDLQGNEAVLDIGCGDGKVTAEIASHVPDGSVLGIDSSADMIKTAQSGFAKPAFTNISFQVANASQLPFENRFDIVFSNAALHWVRDHTPVLKGIFKSLKNNGRILLQMGGQGNASAIICIMNSMITTATWGKYFKDFEFPYGFHHPQDYHIWLDDAGFQSTDARLIHKDMRYDDRAGLSGWIRTTWLPYTQRIPDHIRNEFINELTDRYLERYPPDSAGRIVIKMVRLEVEAVKLETLL
jgi:trans-aconitate 2-methyltransferase